MQDIYQLVHVLNSNEKKSFQYFLRCLGKSTEAGKIVENLFTFLSKRKKCPGKDAALKALRIKKDNHLNVLSFRLKQKLFDFLILENNIEKLKSKDPVNYYSIKQRKKLTQLNFLIRNKGTLKLIETELNSLINDSIKYEIYGVAIDALQLKKQLYIRKRGLKDISSINNKLLLLRETEKYINYAIDFQTYFLTKNEKLNFENSDANKRALEGIIYELKNASENYPSAFLKYFINLFEYYYFTINESYFLARETCLENLELIKKSKSLNTWQRIGSAYIDLYTVDINIREYKKALNNINTALTYFPKYSLNYFITSETKLKVLCYQKKFAQALKQVSLLNEIISNNDILQKNKIIFYKTFILFLKKQFKKANEEIISIKKLNVDKNGMDIYLKLIQICINIALNKFDFAVKLTENTEKYYKRYHAKKFKNERIKKLLKLFKLLSKQDFNNIIVTNAIKKSLTELSIEKNISWEPLTPEVYPLDIWITDHLRLNLKFDAKSLATISTVT